MPHTNSATVTFLFPTTYPLSTVFNDRFHLPHLSQQLRLLTNANASSNARRAASG